MPDKMEKLGQSLVQHGKHSDRVYLMKLGPEDPPAVVRRIEQLAEARDYGKIFCKVPAPAAASFVRRGYVPEAKVPGFFRGRLDAAFVSRFRKPQRARLRDADRAAIRRTLALARARRNEKPARPPAGYHIRPLDKTDASELAAVYRRIFPSYPFPIFDPDYLRRTMDSHIRYYGVFHDDRLVAASSAETDPGARNVEMTDFATLPEQRGHGLARLLLLTMETDMKAAGFATAYTIARATSAGMNVTFARCGYRFGGTLVNNTQIAGRIESMNVCYKRLRPAGPAPR